MAAESNFLSRLVSRTSLVPKNPGLTLVLGIVGLTLVAFLNWLTGAEVGLAILYLVPVVVGCWFGGGTVGSILALVAVIYRTGWDIEGRHYSSQFAPVWNALVRLAVFGGISFLVNLVRDLTLNLHNLVQLRTSALENEIRQRRELERVVSQMTSREHQQLGVEITDQLAGRLAGTAFLAKAISESLDRRQSPESHDARKLLDSLNESMKQLHSSSRLLAPPETASLEAGLSRLAAELETDLGITCIVQAPRTERDPGFERSRLIYNIAQEAVQHAVQKSRAKQVEISLSEQQNKLNLVISFDPAPEAESAATDADELSVQIMRYRAETLGGSLRLERDPLHGAAFTCILPLTA